MGNGKYYDFLPEQIEEKGFAMQEDIRMVFTETLKQSQEIFIT